MSGAVAAMRPRGGGQATRRATEAARNAEQAGMVQMIGEAVSLHVGSVLATLLERQQWQPGCLFCVRAAKALEHEHDVAVKIAERCAEPPPERPEMRVVQAVTLVDGVPACWAHVDLPQIVMPAGVAEEQAAGFREQWERSRPATAAEERARQICAGMGIDPAVPMSAEQNAEYQRRWAELDRA